MQVGLSILPRVFPILAEISALTLAIACSETTNPGETYRLRDRIVFQSDRLDVKRDIFSMALDGSDVRRLTTDSTWDACPSVSPDGESIAYTRENSDLGIMRGDGSDQRILLPKAGSNYMCPIWSPDGEYIASTDGNKIFVVSRDGVLYMTIPGTTTESSIISLAYSPDGTRLLVSEGIPDRSNNSFDRRVWSVRTNNAERGTSVRGLDASWTPKGDSVLYTCFDDLYASPIDYRICMKSAEGTARLMLTTQTTSSPFFTPNGNRIAFVCEGGLCVMNRDGSNPQRWTIGGSRFAWAPNAQMLVFHCGISDPGRFNDEICAVSGDGTNFRNLTRNPGGDDYPSFSPLSSQ